MCSGSVPEYFWECFSGARGGTFGVLVEYFWSTFAVLLGNLGSTFGVLLEYFWGVLLGSTFGVLLEYFWSTFGEYFWGGTHSPWMEVVGAPVRLLFILANSIWISSEYF